MSVSPDYTQFIDLSVYDKDITDIVEAAQTTLQSRIPDWVPSATNIEVMLLEAMAIEVAEAVFSINRIPTTLVQALLALYGVEQDTGTAPTVDLTFTAYDTAGYNVPAGTEVVITTNSGDTVSFFTDAELIIAESTDSGTISATATVNTDIANGIIIGTEVELVDSITGIETVETATVVAGGVNPETLDAWTQRGIQRLQRLSDALVIPVHFTQAALEDPNVFRANTVDNYDPTEDPPSSPGDNPGHVTVVVYGAGGPLTSGQKADIQDSMELRALSNLVIHVVDPTVVTVNVTAAIKVKAGYVEADVIDAVEARLDNYLDPTVWPWAGVVRRNELISIIDQVDGVDYVDALTAPASDVNIGIGTSLATPGTLTITAV